MSSKKKNLKRVRESSELDSEQTKGVGLPDKGYKGSASEMPAKKELDSGKTKGVGYPLHEEDEVLEVEGDPEVTELTEEDEDFLKMFNESYEDGEEDEVMSEDEDEDFSLESEDEDSLMSEDEDLEELLDEPKLEEDEEMDELLGGDDESAGEEEKEELSEEDELSSLLDEPEEKVVDLTEDEESDDDKVFVLDEDEDEAEKEVELTEDEDSEEAKEELKEEDEAEAEEEKKELEEHVKAMFKGEKINLNEAFKNKVSTIFEVALKGKVKKEKKKLEEKATKKLSVIRENMYKKYGKKTDSYLNYVVEQWSKDNKIAIESAFRSKITESFIKDLRGIFLKHDISVPKSKQNLVHKMGRKLEETKQNLDLQIKQNVSQSKRIKFLEKRLILSSLCEGLSAMQSDKLKKLAEGVSFESRESFAKKAKLLKEQYFGQVVKKGSSINEVNSNSKLKQSVNGEVDEMDVFIATAKKIGSNR